MRVIALIAAMLLSFPAFAQDYPDKPVRVLVGWSPGGIADIAARVIAERLSDKWDEQVIVENMAGGSGMIADAAAAAAPADGYTLLLATSPEYTTTPFIRDNARDYFDAQLEPIALVTVNPMVLVANKNSGYESVADLAADAKKRPGEISYGSAGIGSAPHLAFEIAADSLGIELTHIPYKGGGPATVAVAGGEVPVGFVAMGAAVPYAEAGDIRVLGLSTANRVEAVSDWPTLAEEGVPGFDLTVWTGLFVREGTPADIVAKISSDLNEILHEPAVMERFKAVGAVPGDESLEQFNERLAHDREVSRAVIERLNIRAQ